jgi:hypothetical protein
LDHAQFLARSAQEPAIRDRIHDTTKDSRRKNAHMQALVRDGIMYLPAHSMRGDLEFHVVVSASQNRPAITLLLRPLAPLSAERRHEAK